MDSNPENLDTNPVNPYKYNIHEFRLPIEYLSKKKLLDKNIIIDLELTKTEDHESLYQNVFSAKTTFGKNTVEHWSKYYTYDKRFLKETQKLLKSYKPNVTILENDNSNSNTFSNYNETRCDEMIEICANIRNDDNFINKYQYIDFSMFRQYNNNENVLQALTFYNLSSPIISILTPIIMLIIPFFLIKLQGHNISLEKYIEYLKVSFKNHALGSLFNLNFSEVAIEQRVYIILSVAFYGYQIYQNVKSCLSFNDNMIHIHKCFAKLDSYLDYSVKSMKNFYLYTKDLKSYKLFNECLTSKTRFLENFKAKLSSIKGFEYSLSKLFNLGKILQLFYVINDDVNYRSTLEYSFGFNGFIENIEALKHNIREKSINYSKYNADKCKFVNAYFPILFEKKTSLNIYGKNREKDDENNFQEIIKNSYELERHMTITGPNASGKTTLLKATLFNVILNQQIACGFYDKAELKIYNYIHAYINIPDTSGRDSLFQAEARRCKEILNLVTNNSKDKNHFCVFDELYSGTNPYEAVGSAYSLIKYLNGYDNINFILTTHYIELCNKFEHIDTIKNCNMKIIETMDENTLENSFEYTYKLVTGISSIKGGTKVLYDLNYPKSIVDSVKQILLDTN